MLHMYILPINSPIHSLTSSVATVSKECLASNPLTLSAQELHDRCNVLDVGETAVETVGLVESHGFGGFLGVEECCISPVC